MAFTGKNYNGAHFSQSPTIVDVAASAIADVRCKVMKLTASGLALAEDGSAAPIGLAMIEEGDNDISGVESGKVAAGDEVTVLIKDIGFAIAADDIDKGAELMATTGGTVTTAETGKYVIGFALSSATAGSVLRVQIAKYKK